MLDYWEGEARADGVAEEVIQAVVSRLRSYEKLIPTGRADSLKGLWKRIAETYPEAGQKPKVQTQPQRPSQPQRPQRSDDEAQPKVEESEAAPVQSQSQPRQNPPQLYQQKQRQAPPPRFEAATSAKHSQTPAAFSAELTVLQGVGPKNAESLANLGMKTLGVVLFWLSRVPCAARGKILKIHPRSRPDLPLVGFFATRTQYRPNPIGLTQVQLLGRKGNILTVKGLDALNGSPVIDIKPISPKTEMKARFRVPDWYYRLWKNPSKKKGGRPARKQKGWKGRKEFKVGSRKSWEYEILSIKMGFKRRGRGRPVLNR